MDSNTISSAAATHVEAFVEDLRTLVDIDSGTYTPAGIAQVAEYLRPRFEAIGFTVEIRPTREHGPNLIARKPGSGQGRIVIVGHMDTVFPDGEAKRRPFTIADGRAYGPGVYDMKGGLLVGLHALHVLHELGAAPWGEIAFLCNSDEEIGSPESHDLVVELAQDARAALILEPSPEIGRVTVARKGVGLFTLQLKGIAAHAGVEPERGRSAILEMAHRIIALHALNGTIPGVTLNVGQVSGGERPNIVAERATAEIDVRVPDEPSLHAIEAAMQRVAAGHVVPDIESTFTGSFAHRPFVQSDRSKQLFDIAASVGSDLGLRLHGEATGGGSDGNTTAALGIPTLDGLGPVGGLAHNPGEFVALDSIAPRVALFAGLLTRIPGEL